ncbi:PH domain-containing protein [Actinophytocola oryzae]|uniref:Putative membrane protein n=1 Tax=Actinophytocola oryzae TaxID=502181 RepID=A0A4R7UY72_9PSEU|nr:PH domain-containing protein [Actinophytocola oryzae]TDV40475.1 putative membrane protein [Actinophytocola oryzae]
MTATVSAESRTEEGWRQLHPRTVWVTALTIAGILAGVAVPIIIGMTDDVSLLVSVPIAFGGIVVLSGVAAVVDLMRWRYTTYRVTDERVELRYAWVLHKLRSVPRERVRTVDLTANPLQRVFGVAKVTIGTGQRTSEHSHLTLDPVDKAVAEELRRLLLRREAPTAAADPAGSTGTADSAASAAPSTGAVPEPEIARLDWRWIRYAPISVTTPLLGAAAFGAVMQVSEWFKLQGAVFRTLRDLLGGLSVIGLVAVLVVVGILVGIVGSLGLFVEMWFRYRLSREDGNLVMTRGLLTTRSLSLERRRLRGVELVEPLGVRLAGAARVDVIATSMTKKSDDDKTDPKTILPSAPYDTAGRVAAEVLGCPAVTATAVVGHPRAAKWRRVRWALYSVLAVVVVLALLGWLLTVVLLHLAWIAAVVLTPVAVLLALESYRNLGHGLAEEHLVTRYGVGARRTAALVRTGVIGWTITSSPFQRRAGLITIHATTAANKGAYPVYDVGTDEGLRFAEEAVPGLLGPFIER